MIGFGLLFVLLLVSGCAQYYWTKTGAADEQFYRDSHECAKEASPAPVGGAKELKVNDDLYRACLSARGYRRDKYFRQPTASWRGVTE